MTAKEYLNQLRTMNYQIRAKKRELENLREDALFLTAAPLSERVQGGEKTSGNRDIENIEILENMISKNISDKIEFQIDVHKKFDEIQDGRYNAILTDFYINGLKLKEIALDIGYEEIYTRRLHGEALESFRGAFGDEF